MVNLKQICIDILKIDPKIRFVGIWFHNELIQEYNKNVSPYLDDGETDKSVRDAVIRWHTRTRLKNKLGEPEYATAKYGKTCRVTTPLKGKDLILISTEIDCDLESMISKISIMKKNLMEKY